MKARNTQVIKLTKRQKLLLESTSDWIQDNYSGADLVGVAWWFLDCGCMAGMGFSLESGIVTPAVRVDRELVEDGAVSECTGRHGNNTWSRTRGVWGKNGQLKLTLVTIKNPKTTLL